MGEAQHEDQAQATRKSVRVYAPASPGDRSEAPTAGRSCTSTYKKRGPRQKDHGESNNNTSGGGGSARLLERVVQDGPIGAGTREYCRLAPYPQPEVFWGVKTAVVGACPCMHALLHYNQAL